MLMVAAAAAAALHGGVVVVVVFMSSNEKKCHNGGLMMFLPNDKWQGDAYVCDDKVTLLLSSFFPTKGQTDDNNNGEWHTSVGTLCNPNT